MTRKEPLGVVFRRGCPGVEGRETGTERPGGRAGVDVFVGALTADVLTPFAFFFILFRGPSLLISNVNVSANL